MLHKDYQTFEHRIKTKFKKNGNEADIPLQSKGSFNAKLVKNGIIVSNLANYPLLEWKIFNEIETLFYEKGHIIQKGNAMSYRLGETGLPLDSIEGWLAHKIFSKRKGDSVFRRISPIAAILIWAEICNGEKPGYLTLNDNYSKAVKI